MKFYFFIGFISNKQFNFYGVIIFQLSFYKAIPLRAMSRLWGYISGCYIPRQLRYWLYTAYSKLFGVIVHEIELPMESYKSLGEFFARRLKDGARPICLDRPMVRDLPFILNI